MKSKKGQQEIIVTVLLVLIALAAVAGVAVFIMKNVNTATASGEDQQKCLKINLALEAINNKTVSIRRSGDSTIILKNVTIAVAGVIVNGTGNLASGTSQIMDLGDVKGYPKDTEVQAAAILTNNFACQASTEVSLP